MIDPAPTRDLTRTAFAVLFLLALLATSIWILRPFLAPLIWASMLAIATWPLFGRVQAMLRGRRPLAIFTILLVLALAFMVPVFLVIGVIVETAPEFAAWARHLLNNGIPSPPNWISGVPLFGDRITTEWRALAAKSPEELTTQFTPYVDAITRWIVLQLGSAGLLLVDFLMTLVMVGILYAHGEIYADALRSFAIRLAGARGDGAMKLAGQSVRAVAFGVVITALVQAAVGGIGLAIAGVPAAAILTALMFVLSVAQIGAAPILALAAIWLFSEGESGYGIVMVVWTVVVGSLDNVLRPLLIKKNVQLPLLLVFTGVIGGLIAFGPIGLFAGPVVLAVAHTLLMSWIREVEPDDIDGPALGTA